MNLALQFKDNTKVNNLSNELNELYKNFLKSKMLVSEYAFMKGWSLWYANQVINSAKKVYLSRNALYC